MKRQISTLTLVSFIMLLKSTLLYGNNKEVISYTIQVGQTINIQHVSSVAYSISDASIITLVFATNFVRVTGEKAGTTTIKSYLADASSNKSNEYYLNKICTITVVDVKTISILSNIDLSVGETYTYNPIITDAEAETTLTWASSNPSVATIDESGAVTAVAPGKTIITCTAANGVFTQSFVTVTPNLVQNVTLEKQRHEMNVSESVTLAVTVAPENATNKTVKWLSSNENIAQVDDEGNVVAVAPGYCTIYAKADDGSSKFGKCLVRVLGPEVVRGDMNGDGKVTVTDAVQVIDIVLEK